jgi:hypothetical protein
LANQNVDSTHPWRRPTASGYLILRVTSRRLAADPEGVRRDILALAARA